MEKEFFIYGLFCTDNKNIRYIGYASDLEERLKEHKKDISRTKVNTYKKKWINLCVKNGFDIDYIVLDVAKTRSQVCELEKYYIKNYINSGLKIVNGTFGGDGVVMTDEVKQKISKANKGRVMSKEFRENMSRRMKGRKASEETKKKMSETHKKIGTRPIMTDAVKKKISDRMKGKVGLRLGMRHTEEAKKKISETKKGTISPKRKEVLQIDPKTKEIINCFESLTFAQNETGVNNIQRCIAKKRKTAGNYEWKYKL